MPPERGSALRPDWLFAAALACGAAALLGERAVVIRAQQLENRPLPRLVLHRDRYPARIRQHVMRTSPAVGDQLLLDALAGREVGEAIAVQVAELTAPVAKLDPAEAVGPHIDAGP